MMQKALTLLTYVALIAQTTGFINDANVMRTKIPRPLNSRKLNNFGYDVVDIHRSFLQNHHRGGALHLNKREAGPRSSPTSQYYLLSTFAIWRSIVINACVLFLIRWAMSLFVVPQTLCHRIPIPSNRILTTFSYLSDISIPLMSSACCAVQLFLNAIAGVGCAGFNTKLGPLRPYFVSILLFTTIASFPHNKAAYVVLSWCIAFMPEAIHYTNQSLARGDRLEGDTASPSSGLPIIRTVIELDIKDMGCVACIKKIDGTLRKLNPNIVEASSWLNEDAKGGKARVIVDTLTRDDVDNIVEGIVASVKDRGFQCEIGSIKMV